MYPPKSPQEDKLLQVEIADGEMDNKNGLQILKATLVLQDKQYVQEEQDEEAVKAKLRKWYKHRLHLLTATFVAGGVVTVATCGLGAPLWVAALAFGSAAGTGLGVEKVKQDYRL